MEQVILVNEQNEPTGLMEKMEAHEKGLLHRAFSIFIFNNNGELLLQQRALNKYHSPGLWTNTCCSHPRPGEETEDAAARRLYEEMGFHATLTKIFDFTYKTIFSNGLTEHEFDHVFAGIYTGIIYPNKSEVLNYRYANMQTLAKDLKNTPQHYTTWLSHAFPHVVNWWKSRW